jgi:hypothetical protein
MTRLKQAWLALCGKLPLELREIEIVREVTVEKEAERIVEREVFVHGEAVEVDLYEARDPVLRLAMTTMSYGYTPAIWHGKIYASCDQAFAECHGAEVVSRKVWRIGSRYFESPKLVRLSVQPKPKIAKGKRTK